MQTTIPETGFLRLAQIIGRRASARKSALAPIIPVSKATWFKGVRDGRYPAPVKHGGCALYRVDDIRALLAAMGAEAGSVS